MKKSIIAAIVGGLILFFWQFISWSLAPVHTAEMQYTANQDAVLECLKSSGLKPGHYMMPNVPPDMEPSEHQAAMEGYMGKPWARVSYHEEMSMSMGMNMARGLTIDILAVLLLSWLLLKISNLDMKTSLLATFAVGFIGYLTIPYLNAIWFEVPTLGYIVDVVVGWGLVGLWLGWWLPRKG